MANRIGTRDITKVLRPMNDPLEDTYVSRRQAKVIAVFGDVVTITFPGDTTPIPGVYRLASYSPTVNDIVWVDIKGGDLLILGKQA